MTNNKIVVSIYNLGGNKTALCIDENYSRQEKKKINDRILYLDKTIEQVGFIKQDRFELNMAGGEFCSNATRCAIKYYGEKLNIKNVSIKVSGYNTDIIGLIKENMVKINIQIDKDINNIIFNDIVKIDGIYFKIFDENNSKQLIQELKADENKAKEKIKLMMKKIINNNDVLGFILLEGDNDNLLIHPIVWVKTIDTLYYETSCGSGSLSAAIYQYNKYEQTLFNMLQPSGYGIKIKLDVENSIIKNALLEGQVMKENEIILD